jgi:hypothetical protein
LPKIIKGGDEDRAPSTGTRDHKAQGSKVKPPKPSSFESQMPIVRKEVDAGQNREKFPEGVIMQHQEEPQMKPH